MLPIFDNLIINFWPTCKHRCGGCYLNHGNRDAVHHLLSVEHSKVRINTPKDNHDHFIPSEIFTQELAKNYIISQNIPEEYSQKLIDKISWFSNEVVVHKVSLETTTDHRDFSVYERSNLPGDLRTRNISLPLTALNENFLDRIAKYYNSLLIKPSLNIRMSSIYSLDEGTIDTYLDRLNWLAKQRYISRVYWLYDKPLMSRYGKVTRGLPIFNQKQPLEYREKMTQLYSRMNPELLDISKRDQCLSAVATDTNCGAGITWASIYALYGEDTSKMTLYWSGCPYGRDFYSFDKSFSLREQAELLRKFFSQKGNSEFNTACSLTNA